jgi:hypothetical protein
MSTSAAGHMPLPPAQHGSIPQARAHCCMATQAMRCLASQLCAAEHMHPADTGLASSSSVCAAGSAAGHPPWLGGRRMSHRMSCLSSPTEPKMSWWWQCHATSSTTPWCSV